MGTQAVFIDNANELHNVILLKHFTEKNRAAVADVKTRKRRTGERRSVSGFFTLHTLISQMFSAVKIPLLAALSCMSLSKVSDCHLHFNPPSFAKGVSALLPCCPGLTDCFCVEVPLE